MFGFIDGINMNEIEAEKYWQFGKSYKGDVHKEIKYMIESGRYIGSEKKDGFYMRLIKDEDGNIIFHGRKEGVDGTYANKIDWVPQFKDFFNSLPNGTCLLGEAYLPNNRGSRNITKILGCLKEKALKRQEKEEKLHYYIFDIWAFNGKSYLNKTIEERVETLSSLKRNCSYIDFAEYLEGKSLWNRLGEILSSGGEGIVMTKKGSKPEPGKRTARKTLKVKMEIENTIDAFLTGNYKPATIHYNSDKEEDWCYWQNDKTGEKYNRNMFDEYCHGATIFPITKAHYYGWASSVEFGLYRDGKIIPIGWISGITDELKAEIVEYNENCIGRVAELTAMEIEKDKGGNYSLRHGRIKQWRAASDKKSEDCLFSQLE